ncbi:MAG: nucleotidyl transferase AbiEii/AbiGii toxin family protein [Oscillospiraceae bacterium]|nr:nucleotidyl transferase AbiEii/AbiGii toxin family protein [Oscillospiraceae bacterium]
MSSDWRIKHSGVISNFIYYLNKISSNYILKGGTALCLCYALDRFSEDIDLDGKEKGFAELVEKFCIDNGYSFRIAKSTDTVERCMVNYGNNEKPLKIEVSYRRKQIGDEEIEKNNGILVYKIEPLCIMKVNAYTNRDKIRDLYDITFICNHYFNMLSPQAVAILRSAVEYKGIEQFDYIIQNQQDDFIDKEKLSEDFLNMYGILGLLYDGN